MKSNWKWFEVKDGCTRKVFLIGKYAIKIPQTSYEWKHFLLGLLANMQERHFSLMRDERMCPVLFSTFGGWFLIMPRCIPLSRGEFFELNIDLFLPCKEYNCLEEYETFNVPVEHKQCSFGWYKNKIVAIDYGS